MCRVLEISESGYYRWRQRQPSRRSQQNEKLLASIRGIMVASQWSYGAPRVAAQLCRNGVKVSVNRVARLMRVAGLSASVPKKYVPSTRGGARAHGIEDRVNRQYGVAEPDQLWVADATYLYTLDGTLYLAVVQDACSRRILGWVMQTCQDVGLMSQALQMALRGRRCKGVIHLRIKAHSTVRRRFKGCVERMGLSSRWAVSATVMTMRRRSPGLPP